MRGLVLRPLGLPDDQGRAGVCLDRVRGRRPVAQLRRTVTMNRKKTVEVVCLITSDRCASPGRLGALACIGRAPPRPGKHRTPGTHTAVADKILRYAAQKGGKSAPVKSPR